MTALWHLERKPPITMVNMTASLSLLSWLERRVDLHGSTRDEAKFPFGCPGGTPRSMLALERNPELPASTPAEDLRPGRDGRGIRVAPPESRGDWSSLRPRKRVPEVPILTPEEPCHNSRETRRFSPQDELRSFCPGHLERNPTFPPETRKGP